MVENVHGGDREGGGFQMIVVDPTGLVDGSAVRTGHGWICLMAKRELWGDSQVCG